MNRADTRLPDPELEHLPVELRELAAQWREPMPDQDRRRALEQLERSAQETRNLGMLWALDGMRRSKT
ncbi:MAG TPA: hypothetical protein VLW45_08255 [Pelomicrobium sp.]|nr:hypothetical protein [Pelomicrobium sp.]